MKYYNNHNNMMARMANNTSTKNEFYNVEKKLNAIKATMKHTRQ